MTKECKQQFTLRITQANSTQLIVILYEMTLQYLADGEQAVDDAGLTYGRNQLTENMADQGTNRGMLV